MRTFKVYESVDIIPGFFDFTYVQNQGAAFGLFSTALFPFRTLLLVLFSLMAMGFIFYTSRRWPHQWQVQAPLGMVLGGAVGNLLDRLRFGSVVDFIEVGYHQWRWPVFNVADSFITVGVAALIFYFWEAPAK